MFLPGKIRDIEEIHKLTLNSNVLFFLDTNIVIDLCNLWNKPQIYKKNNDYNELVVFAEFIIKNTIDFYPLTGIWESTRLIEDKNLGEKKQDFLQETILNCLKADINTFANHINSNEIIEGEKFPFHFPKTNIRLIFRNNEIQGILLLKYCSLLKLFLLIKDEENYIERIKLFLDFLFDDLGIIDVGSLVASLIINNPENIKLFFDKMNGEYLKIIKNIYSASFDLSIIEYSNRYCNSNNYSIFITKDKVLHKICEAVKIIGFCDGLPIKKINEFIIASHREEYIKHFTIKSRTHQKINIKNEILWSKVRNLEKLSFNKLNNNLLNDSECVIYI